MKTAGTVKSAAPPSPPISEKAVQMYIQSVLKASAEKPDSLDKSELRLARRYARHKGAAKRAEEDLSQIRQQIAQAETRARSLELIQEHELGKAEAFLEFLVDTKFETDAKPELVPEASSKEVLPELSLIPKTGKEPKT